MYVIVEVNCPEKWIRAMFRRNRYNRDNPDNLREKDARSEKIYAKLAL